MRACWDQSPEARPTFAEITQQIRQMALKYPFTDYRAHAEATVEAPTGYVFFVHTEVLGGNQLWDQMPDDMLKSMSKFYFNLIPSLCNFSHTQPFASRSTWYL